MSAGRYLISNPTRLSEQMLFESDLGPADGDAEGSGVVKP